MKKRSRNWKKIQPVIRFIRKRKMSLSVLVIPLCIIIGLLRIIAEQRKNIVTLQKTPLIIEVPLSQQSPIETPIDTPTETLWPTVTPWPTEQILSTPTSVPTIVRPSPTPTGVQRDTRRRSH